jgi:hypothetical protein
MAEEVDRSNPLPMERQPFLSGDIFIAKGGIVDDT